MTKICSLCKEPDERLGKNGWCRVCNRRYQKQYYSKNKEVIKQKKKVVRRQHPEKSYFGNLKLRYGIDQTWFEQQWFAQEGKCICGHRFELFSGDYKNTPQVDHCHVTGEARGLLCYKCNTAIGLLDLDLKSSSDSLDLVAKRLKYLEKM